MKKKITGPVSNLLMAIGLALCLSACGDKAPAAEQPARQTGDDSVTVEMTDHEKDLLCKIYPMDIGIDHISQKTSLTIPVHSRSARIRYSFREYMPKKKWLGGRFPPSHECQGLFRRFLSTLRSYVAYRSR